MLYFFLLLLNILSLITFTAFLKHASKSLYEIRLRTFEAENAQKMRTSRLGKKKCGAYRKRKSVASFMKSLTTKFSILPRQNQDEVLKAQRFYQPVAEVIRKHFTNEVLKLIDEPEVQNLNLDLPTSIFPGPCISPCGLWGWSSTWCATAKPSGSKYSRWWHKCP